MRILSPLESKAGLDCGNIFTPARLGQDKNMVWDQCIILLLWHIHHKPKVPRLLSTTFSNLQCGLVWEWSGISAYFTFPNMSSTHLQWDGVDKCPDTLKASYLRLYCPWLLRAGRFKAFYYFVKVKVSCLQLVCIFKLRFVIIWSVDWHMWSGRQAETC